MAVCPSTSWTRGPAAHERDAPASVGQEIERAVEFRARHLAERGLDIGYDGAAILVDEIAIGPLPRRAGADLGQRGLHAQLQLVSQRLLEARIAGKSQLGHETQDGRAADPGALGELRHRFQTRHGIVGEQRQRRLALRGSQQAKALTDGLRDRQVGLAFHPSLQRDIRRPNHHYKFDLEITL